MSRLCLTLAEQSIEELEGKIRQYAGSFPLMEVRLDYLVSPRLPALPAQRSSEMIATCRPTREGGRYAGNEPDRLELLTQAAHHGFDWVDVEHDVSIGALPSGINTVRSYHDFTGCPADLDELYQTIRRQGGDVTKLAVTVADTRDLTRLLKLLEKTDGQRRIMIAMGPFGQPSRLLGHFAGNAWTYVVEQAEAAVAPGQFGFDQAIRRYRLDYQGPEPRVYGVLGNPLAHSLSPPLHNRLFSYYGLDCVYLPFQLSSVEPFFDYLAGSRLSFGGFSVTLPFKTDVVKYAACGDRSERSINTLVAAPGGWTGLNTDYPGFLKPLASFGLAGRRALVLGAGGVAHTVVRALQDSFAAVTVVGRDRARVVAFCRLHGCSGVLFSDLPIRADICVNCTPVGQYPNLDASPLEEKQLNFDLVYDLIYHPERTRLLRLAEKRGLKTISGIDMFVEQAALQFRAWTGIDADRALVAETVRSLLTTKS